MHDAMIVFAFGFSPITRLTTIEKSIVPPVTIGKSTDEPIPKVARTRYCKRFPIPPHAAFPATFPMSTSLSLGNFFVIIKSKIKQSSAVVIRPRIINVPLLTAIDAKIFSLCIDVTTPDIPLSTNTPKQ